MLRHIEERTGPEGRRRTSARAEPRRPAARAARRALAAVVAAVVALVPPPAGAAAEGDDAGPMRPLEGVWARPITERRGGWTVEVETRDEGYRPGPTVRVLRRPPAGGSAEPGAAAPEPQRFEVDRFSSDLDLRLHPGGWVVLRDRTCVRAFAPDSGTGEIREDLQVTSASRFLAEGFLSVGVAAARKEESIRIAWAQFRDGRLERAVELARIPQERFAVDRIAESHVRAVASGGGVDVSWIVPGAREFDAAETGAAHWDAATGAVTPLPPPGTVRVAAVQFPSVMGDVARNLDRIEGLVADAANAGAKFVVLPETCVPGYLSQDLKVVWRAPGRPVAEAFADTRDPADVAETVPGPSTRRLAGIARRWGVYLTAPLLERGTRPGEGDAPPKTVYFNTVALLGPDGRELAHYRKLNPWPHPEQSWATEGDRGIRTADTPYGRVGLAICFDVHKVFAMYAAAEPKPWAVLYPIAWVSRGDDAKWFGEELPRRVGELGFHVVGANWSTDAPQPWHGAGFSTIVAADGKVLAQARTKVGAEIVTADLAIGDGPE